MKATKATKATATGFTLIELLVVMAIVVLLAVMGYRLLTVSLTTQQVVEQRSETLRELQLGLWILQQDMSQLQTAPLPNASLPLVSLFDSSEYKQTTEAVELWRFFIAPNAETLQGVTQVRYLLADDTLVRETVYQGQSQQSIVLTQIDAVSLIFYDDDNRRVNQWLDEKLPRTMGLIFTHARYGEVTVMEALGG
ncbi:type II secretion system minor pseudopilin GspJ [Ostreibacterium oceani]|nr:type II secretion system minor pseudopilin GspJ [Ostreibacterium oceani]